jgi:hypothetical protein
MSNIALNRAFALATPSPSHSAPPHDLSRHLACALPLGDNVGYSLAYRITRSTRC